MLMPVGRFLDGDATASERGEEEDIMIPSMKGKPNMNDSEMTPPTDSGSISEREDDPCSWFGGISSDFKHLATSIKDTIPPTIGGIADFVHRSAMSVAAEIAQLERDGELDAEGWKDDRFSSKNFESLQLPWEVTDESNPDVFIEEMGLKEIILGLSQMEGTFLGPFKPNQEERDPTSQFSDFVLDEPRIHLIRRLLELDENLAAMHARLSGRSDVRETVFWKNYFFHCDENRQSHLRERDSAEDCSLRNSLESLVPVTDSSSVVDDSSYVCVSGNLIRSAPSSMNSLTEVRSVGDMVVIETGGGDSREDEA